jgi:hypothetical protein
MIWKVTTVQVGNMTSINDVIEMENIISPPEKASTSFIYPAMTWLERDCMERCVHGDCNDMGMCACTEQGYYGLNCDLLCNGDVRLGVCYDLRTVYIGGMLMDARQAEYEAVSRLAVELVNNKTDGFFDFTSRIHFEFMLNYTECNTDIARAILDGMHCAMMYYDVQSSALQYMLMCIDIIIH